MRKIKLFMLMLLIMGHTILGPIAVSSETFECRSIENAEEEYECLEIEKERENQQMDATSNEVAEDGVTLFGAGGAVITENIITNIEIYDEKDGTSIQDPDVRPEQGSDIWIEFEWTVPADNDYFKGSTFTFQLPAGISLGGPVSGVLTNAGTFTIDANGQVVFTFDDHLIGGQSLSGDFKAWRKFDESKFDGELEQEVVFEFEGTVIKSIPVHFKNPFTNEIEKTGIAYQDNVENNMNPNKIKWTVDINLQEKTIENAIFKDTLPPGLSIDESSIEVHELTLNLDKTLTVGTEFTNYTKQVSVNGDVIELNITNDITKAYRVTYTTEVAPITVSPYEKTFTNRAELTGDEFTKLGKSASVFVKFNKPLSKSAAGYDGTTQTITWKIQYNYNEQEIENAIAYIEDSFDPSHELVDNSLQVYGMTIEPDGNGTRNGSALILGTDYAIHKNGSGFRLQFLATQGIKEAYEIEYETTSIDRVYGEGIVIENTVKAPTVSDEETANETIGQVIFSKNNGVVDFGEKKIKWTLQLNRDSKLMSGVVITDNFVNKHMTIDPDSLSISGLTKDNDYIIEPDPDYGEGFKITFKNDISTPHEITYETIFDSTKPVPTGGYTNNAKLSWEGRTITKSGTPTIDDYTKDNGNKTGTYDATTKEITWEIDVNYNLHEINETIVRDFYTGEQTFVENSLEIYHLTLTGSGNGVGIGANVPVDNDKFIQPIKDAAGNDGFELNLGKINSAFRIIYKTSLENHPVLSEYKNEATLYDGDPSKELFSKSVRVQPPHGGEYVTKTGKQIVDYSDVALWKVLINRSQSFVDAGSKLTDELSSNQILLSNSFKLFETTVTKNGAVSKKVVGGEAVLVDKAEYTISVVDNGFTLTFHNDLHAAYILEYQSFINADHKEEITNEVKFAGQTHSAGRVDYEGNHEVLLYGAEGGANPSGKGKLKILKVNLDDTNEVLSGAIFELYNASGEVLLETLITDGNGEAETKNDYRYNDTDGFKYQLKEVAAPVGYAIADEYKDKTEIVFKDPDFIFTIKNKIIKQAVKLTKVDQSGGALLEGAHFTLYDADDKIVVKSGKELTNLVTDVNGEILINDLDAGNYYFEETKAPIGYRLDIRPVKFEIKQDQTDVEEETMENNVNEESITLIKVKQNNDGTFDEAVKLQGAEFKLYKQNGDLVSVTYTDSNGDVVVVETFTTNKHGELIIEDLAPGDYYFVETKASSGYQLDRTKYEFTIEVGKATSITVGNRVLTWGGTFPVDPEVPENPIDSENPGDNEDPEESETPNDPDNPTDNEDPEESETPNDPDNPTDLEGDGDSTDPGTGLKPDSGEKGQKGNLLPQTGEGKLMLMLILGMFSLLMGTIMIFYNIRVRQA